MAQYNIEGDINNITERQLEFISKVVRELGHANSKVTVEPVGQAGDNYIANVKRVKMEGENGNLKMIAKIAPTDELHRMATNTFIMFKNEHVMYTEVLPKLVQLQINAGVPEKEQLRYAKCYGSLSEAPNEVILLEDLGSSDFTMLDRFAPLSDECVKSVLKNFAIYHSLSYALRYKEPETLEHFKHSLIDIWSIMSNVEVIKSAFKGLEDQTISILNDPESTAFLTNKVAECLELTSKLAKTDFDSKYNVIQQGDAWTNNIMFKFDGDKLTESIMIDYQTSRNNSPVADILYMIFNCTDYGTTIKNFHDWIDYYHTELDKSLSNFGLKANYIYPRDRLDADLKRYGKILFGQSIILASVLIRKSEDAEKMMDMAKSENGMEKSMELTISSLDEDSQERYKNKILGLISSCKELGL